LSIVEEINTDIPWAYFDGTTPGTPSRGGARGIIYFSINQSISFKARIGQQTNNYCELMALKLILMMA
jgi:ribonuclease HI